MRITGFFLIGGANSAAGLAASLSSDLTVAAAVAAGVVDVYTSLVCVMLDLIYVLSRFT